MPLGYALSDYTKIHYADSGFASLALGQVL